MSIETAKLSGTGWKRPALVLSAVLITLIPAVPAMAGICDSARVDTDSRLAAVCERTAREQVEPAVVEQQAVADATTPAADPVIAPVSVVEDATDPVMEPVAQVIAVRAVKQEPASVAQVRPVARPENLQPTIKLASGIPYGVDYVWTSGVYR